MSIGKATVLIFGGMGGDQTEAIQRAVRDAGFFVYSPDGRDDWANWERAKMLAVNAEKLVVIGHSWGQEAVANICKHANVDLAILIDPVRRDAWFNPWAKIDAPDAGEVQVFTRTDTPFFPPYTARVKGVTARKVRGGHNSICRDLWLIGHIVDAVRAI